ncbi:MAG: Smr/MutS family protein [Nitrospiraceae bacterium]|nr:Smr/MutS family protein [Nitrospiraceae bacterium]
MSNKKKTEKPEGDFRNNAFNALKGMKAKATVAAVPAKRAEPAAGSIDDDELFQRAMSGAKRIEDEEEIDIAEEPQRKAPASKPSLEHEDDSLFHQAMQSIGAASFGRQRAAESPDEEERRSPSSRMKQVKRGTLRITQEIDLHGFVREEALRRLDYFISTAQARGHQAVLVITGKGTNSPEGPVLQGAVAEWLRTRGKKSVAEFHPAPRDKGGSGAYVVFLRHL